MRSDRTQNSHAARHALIPMPLLLALAALAALALACGSSNTAARATPTDVSLQQDPTVQPTDVPADESQPESTFVRGLNLSPRGFPNTFEEWSSFFQQAAAIPDTAVIWNGAWREDAAGGSDAGQVPESAAAVASTASQHDLGTISVFGWRSGETLYLNVPDDPTNNWTNQRARQLYVHTVQSFAAEHQPDYLLLGNENDFYYAQAPDDYANWLVAYEAAYSAIKASSPDTRVGPVFNFEHLSGTGALAGWETPHWGALESHNTTSMDVVGLTLYPWMHVPSPDQIPETGLQPLLERLGDTPLVITETGWPAETLGDLQPAWETSEPAQVEYLAALGAMLPDQQVEVVSWVFLHPMQDPGGQPTDWKLFGSISLLDAQGEPRPVYDAWISFRP